VRKGDVRNSRRVQELKSHERSDIHMSLVFKRREGDEDETVQNFPWISYCGN
jgi:hypothetical protein